LNSIHYYNQKLFLLNWKKEDKHEGRVYEAALLTILFCHIYMLQDICTVMVSRDGTIYNTCTSLDIGVLQQ